MTTTFNWQVTRLEVQPQIDDKTYVVLKVDFTVTATDNTNTAEVNSYAYVTYSEENTFVPYQDLTEQQILSWVWNVVDREKVEQGLQNRLTQTTSPLSVSLEPPWNPTNVLAG